MPMPVCTSKKSSKPITLAASKSMRDGHNANGHNESTEEVDSSSPSCSAYSPSPTLMFDLASLLERLQSDPGYMALLSGKELELLAEMEVLDGKDGDKETRPEIMKKYDKVFLRQIQEAADRHLVEKNEIRNALGLLKIYHNANTTSSSEGLCDKPSNPAPPSMGKVKNGSLKDNTGSAQRNRKNIGSAKSEGNGLAHLEPHPEASPNKRRRDCDKN